MSVERANKNKKQLGKIAQATIEYILLLAMILFVANKGIKQIREIFFGWNNQDGAIVLMLKKNIASKLSTDGF